VPVHDSLRESESRYRTLAEHVRDVITEISADGIYLYASPSFAESWGWDPGEVVGKSAFDLIHPEDQVGIQERMAQAMAANEPSKGTFRFLHKDGSWRWVESTGRPYRDADGAFRGVIVSRDVTDRVDAERALQEQLEVERRIAELSRSFLHVMPDQLEAAVRRGLGVAGELAGADRSTLYLQPLAAGTAGGHREWHYPDADSRRLADPEEGIRDHRWAAERLLAGEMIHVPSVAELPDEAAAERAALLAKGTASYLAIPIHDPGRSLGVIDFHRAEQRPWSEAEITRLGLIAEVLGGAVRRLLAEQERCETEERFRTLTRHAHDAICEFDLAGNLLYVSGSYDQLTGYSWQELKDRDPWSLLHPDDHERLRQEAAAAASAAEPTRITCRLLHRDGGVRWLESTVKPFRTPAGEARLAVVVRDVTERQAVRMELERQLEIEKRLARFSRILLEGGVDTPDAGIERGLEAAASLAAADRAFLVSALDGAATRATAYDWNSPEVPPRPHKVGTRFDTQGWMTSRLSAGEPVRIPDVANLPEEAREIREGLLESGVRSYLCLPIASDGQLHGVVGFHCLTASHDWTDSEVALLQVVVELLNSALRRKGAEIRLEESQHRLLQAQKMEAVGTLAGGIAHDFNNQLTVMLANARFARREAKGDDDLRQALDDLHRAAEHCAQLTRSLLAFSRRATAEPRALEVGQIIDEAQDLLRPLIPGSIRFEVRAHQRDACIEVDPTQLQQVLVNLIVNARDALPDGGEIRLEASTRMIGPASALRLGLSSPGSYVELLVSDTGTGIEEPVLKRVFEPFFTTKPVGRGTGLGLATAYGIVEQSGGAIEVESEPGRGSSFRVLLPQIPGGESEPRDVVDDWASRGTGTLLLVEDEQRVRRLVSRILRDAGYEVLEAADGAEALRIGLQHVERIDGLVTDVDMPEMSGVELARRLVEERPDLPVLYISGFGQEGLEGERSRFLSKPFTEGLILESLRQLIPES
jgi:PAS domain S-box-containing protein